MSFMSKSKKTVERRSIWRVIQSDEDLRALYRAFCSSHVGYISDVDCSVQCPLYKLCFGGIGTTREELYVTIDQYNRSGVDGISAHQKG